MNLDVKTMNCYADERGNLHVLDFNNINQLNYSTKLYFGKNQTIVIKDEVVILAVLSGSIDLFSDSEKNTLIEGQYCYIDFPQTFDLKSLSECIYVILRFDSKKQISHKINCRNENIIPLELNIKDNFIDLSLVLNSLQFSPKRLFYITNVPEGKIRGNHYHISCSELIMTARGSFTLSSEKEKYDIQDLSKAYLIPPKVLSKESNFSSNAICLVFADMPYDPNGYFPK